MHYYVSVYVSQVNLILHGPKTLYFKTVAYNSSNYQTHMRNSSYK